MLLYLDSKHDERQQPPPWLLDDDGNWAPDLQCSDADTGRAWAIGECYMVGPRTSGWEDLTEGYQVQVIGRVDPLRLLRAQRWADMVAVEDGNGNIWPMPVLLTASGNRAIRCTYGKDFLPAPTPMQSRLLDIAQEARIALENARDGKEGVDMAIACRWAAEVMASMYYLTPEVIGVARILDEDLVIGVLSAMVSLPIEVPNAPGV